uniref:Glutamyl-tRNA(Gln) amidotransferase subunit C, mitochondrial n=1 Tax=Cacopsylla melanoneura TaxID=428564 RepID=A0A8D9B348_9HEMI
MNRLYSITRWCLIKPKLNAIENQSKAYSTKQQNPELKSNFIEQNTETNSHSQELKQTGNEVVLDDTTVKLLERLSLVNFGSERSKIILQDAIEFANKIQSVNVDNVEPLVNILEQEHTIQCRDDVVNMDNSMEDIVMNAKHVEEDYFVAPPSNVPLYQSEDAASTDEKSKS